MTIVSRLIAVGLPLLAFTIALPRAQAISPSNIAFQGPAAERFLQDAQIEKVVELGQGITRPRKVTLALDDVTHDSVFKWIDERRAGVYELADGTRDVGFQDTWQTEVAAYRLDRLIGLGMVPATVERSVQGDEGSLQWWVDAMMSEADRVDDKVQPPDMEAWNRQRFKVWLFDELIANVDRHMDNLLVTSDFQIRLIDHSRSFRENAEVRKPDQLTRFSRSLLDGLEGLTMETVREQLGRYLSGAQMERLLNRRDAILALAQQRIAERGEAAVIYP